MCSLWSNLCAQRGAFNMLSVEQSMHSLCSNRCAHCAATNVLTVEQSMCSLWGNQCAHCAAIDVLTVQQSTVLTAEQSICIQIQHSCNSAATNTINIKSFRRHTLHAAIRNQLRTFSDVIVWCAVKGTSVPSVTKMRHRRLHERLRVIPSCVASDLRGMERRIMVQVCVYTNGRFGNNTQKKVLYYEWQVHVS